MIRNAAELAKLDQMMTDACAHLDGYLAMMRKLSATRGRMQAIADITAYLALNSDLAETRTLLMAAIWQLTRPDGAQA
jgi:hypothetical protein